MRTVSETRRINLIEAIRVAGSAEALAEAANVSAAYISQVKNGLPDSKTGTPKNAGDQFARKIETGIKKPRGWMDQNSPGVNRDSATSSVQNIKNARPQNQPVPVFSLNRAETMKEIGGLHHILESDRWESPDYMLGPRGWAHIVEGDSMDDGTTKGIPEGYLLFVDPDIVPQAGNFVIAKDVTTQSATFKKLILDGGRWYLKPLNRQYQVIEIDSPALCVIGVVTEARAPARRLI